MRFIGKFCAVTLLIAAPAFGADNIKVIDGDSVTVDGKEYRLRNHNAPEIGTKGPGRAHCEQELRLGRKATTRLEELIKDGQAKRTLEFKPAGVNDATHARRPLAVLSVDGKDVGKTLREEGLAKRSSGKGHRDFCG